MPWTPRVRCWLATGRTCARAEYLTQRLAVVRGIVQNKELSSVERYAAPVDGPAVAKPAGRLAVVRNALGNPNLVKVEVGTAIGVLGHAAFGATMAVIIYKLMGTPGVANYTSVRLLAGAFGAPVYAALAGRFRRERVLAAGFLADAVAVALVILVSQLHTAPALLFIPLALEGFAHSAPRALHDALLPWLADSPAQLVASNSFSATIDTLAGLFGSLLALAGLWLLPSQSAVLVIVVILVVIGALPLLAIRGVDTRGGSDGSHIIAQIAGGIGVLRRLPNARAVVVILMLTVVVTGFEHVNAPSIATQILHMNVDDIPLLGVFGSAGAFVGGIASLSFGRRSLSVSLAIGLLIAASALSALTVTSNALALPLLSLFSIGMLYQGVCARTLLQRTASGQSLDLLVGVNVLIGTGVSALAAQAAGALNVGVGVRATLGVTAAMAILGAVYSVLRLSKVERQAPAQREEVDAIRHVDAFGPLSVAAASQLADSLVAQEAAEDEVIVQQGEPADDMFVIKSGVFDTTVDGEYVRTLQHGDHFGEIALLFNAPRTATVRCVQAGSLFRLCREDFLRAVTGNTTTEAAMNAIVDERLAHAGEVDSADGH